MRRLFVLIVLASAFAAGAPAADATAGPTVYAHRGGAAEAPENTLGAFRRSVANYGTGVWLEMDVHLTLDGELVVIHDATLDRTTECTGPVRLKTLAQVQACNAATGWNETHDPDWPAFEPVPSLREVLAEGKAGGWKVLPELKNIPGDADFDPTGVLAASELLAVVDEVGFPAGDIVVQSFFPTSLDHVELASDIDTALLTTSQLHGGLPPGTGFTLGQNALYSNLRGYEIAAPNHDAPDVTAQGVAEAQALDLDVVVWTVDEPTRAQQLAGFGVDGIITNAPGAIVSAL